MMKYKIFANHAHVFPKVLRETATVDCLLELMDECEIEKAVCFANFHDRFSESNIDMNTNQFLAQEIASHDDLYGFGTIDFDRDDLEDQVKEIEALGFYGIKLHPAYQEFNIMSEKAQRVYAEAKERNLFLSFHTGVHWHRIADYQMLLYDEIAYNFPGLRFSMEHLGGYHFFREGLAVMVNNSRNDIRNTFAGWTSISLPENGLYDEWSLSDDQLRTLIYQTDNESHIFGLDFPYNNAEKTKAAIDRILSLDIPEEAKEGILGKNLARELNIEL